MITIHHLNNSRSLRIIWLMEEIGVDYNVKCYERDKESNRAPQELRDIHPLGKSPVITDGDRVVAESGHIIDYILRHHGNGQLRPSMNDAAYEDYNYWLHFAEGTGMLPMLLALYTGFLGEAATPIAPIIQSEIDLVLRHLNDSLEGKDYLAGDTLTGADVNNLFILEGANLRGRLDAYPNLQRYLKEMQARDGYQRALAKSKELNSSYMFAGI